jgi:hypothetical protein
MKFGTGNLSERHYTEFSLEHIFPRRNRSSGLRAHVHTHTNTHTHTHTHTNIYTHTHTRTVWMGVWRWRPLITLKPLRGNDVTAWRAMLCPHRSPCFYHVFIRAQLETGSCRRIVAVIFRVPIVFLRGHRMAHETGSCRRVVAVICCDCREAVTWPSYFGVDAAKRCCPDAFLAPGPASRGPKVESFSTIQL